RERADVEENVMQRLAPGAPLDGRGRDRERQSGTGAEQGRARERTHGADGDGAEIELERERLPGADERDDRDHSADVVVCPEDEAGNSGPGADQADKPDHGGQALGEREKGRTVNGMRAWVPTLVRRMGLDLRWSRQTHLVVAIVG